MNYKNNHQFLQLPHFCIFDNPFIHLLLIFPMELKNSQKKIVVQEGFSTMAKHC